MFKSSKFTSPTPSSHYKMPIQDHTDAVIMLSLTFWLPKTWYFGCFSLN